MKEKKISLKCHTCGARFAKLEKEKEYEYEKRINDTILVFKAIARCLHCGTIHGELVSCEDVDDASRS